MLAVIINLVYMKIDVFISYSSKKTMPLKQFVMYWRKMVLNVGLFLGI